MLWGGGGRSETYNEKCGQHRARRRTLFHTRNLDFFFSFNVKSPIFKILETNSDISLNILRRPFHHAEGWPERENHWRGPLPDASPGESLTLWVPTEVSLFPVVGGPLCIPECRRCRSLLADGSKSESQVFALLLMKAQALQIQIGASGLCHSERSELPLHLLVPCFLFS